MAAYTIIGHDQKQYGPITEAQLRQWIADGRVNAQTQVQVEGATEWKTAAEIPEFQAALAGAVPPSLSPALTAATITVAPKMSGLAVTSLVLGILGVATCGITVLLSAPIGLILGFVAMRKIGKSQGQLRGKGVALAGIITSGVLIVLIPILAAILLPALAKAIPKAQEINCMNNEKQLALAVILYSNDHTNRFPPAAEWCDAIKPSVGSDMNFRCVAADPSSRCDYAFNSKLDGLELGKVNAQTVMIFEANGGWNANGGPELLPAKARHLQKFYVVAFVDGHVEAVTQSRLATLRWDP